MKSLVKTLLTLVLVLTAASAWAQAAGNWQKIHGQVQAIQGPQITVKTDDGRVITVDMSQVSQSVQGAMTPNMGVTVTGFPGNSANRFTARYIEQDGAPPASATASATGNTAVNRVLPLVPQFASSQEFQNRAASFRSDRAKARVFVNQLYRGFLEREATDQERSNWANYLLQSNDVKGTVEQFLTSPEYLAKNKNEQQAISDLYEAFFNRTPTAEEINAWQRRIAQN